MGYRGRGSSVSDVQKMTRPTMELKAREHTMRVAEPTMRRAETMVKREPQKQSKWAQFVEEEEGPVHDEEDGDDLLLSGDQGYERIEHSDED